jgi:hypothetical protein
MARSCRDVSHNHSFIVAPDQFNLKISCLGNEIPLDGAVYDFENDKVLG